MANKKYYVIFKGRNPETGEDVVDLVLHTIWSEAELYVKGVPNAKYKGCKTEGEALKLINKSEGRILTDVREISHEPNTIFCYVDGSFNESIMNYGFGLVVFKNGKIVHFENGSGTNPEAVKMRQIGGELLGAMKALNYASNIGEKKVVIYHDYKGVRTHALGEWKRKTEHSKVYYDWMQQFFTNHPDIQVTFEKVDAHTGNAGNELADGLAKRSVNLEPNKVFYNIAQEFGINTKQ